MTSDDRKRLFERIQKCLNLSASNEPHEAAAALRQAQKLMEKHGLTEADILGAGILDEKVSCPIQATNNGAPAHLKYLVSLIHKAFGVKSIITTSMRVSDRGIDVHYFGQAHRLPMATYAHKVVYKAMEDAWKENLIKHPEWKGVRGGRASFMIGWISSIREKVIAIGFTETEETALYARIKNIYPQISKMTGSVKTFSTMKRLGELSGSNFSLYRPMDGEQQKKLS